MFESDPRRRLRVGLFTAALLGLLAAAVLLMGRTQGLFVRHVAFEALFTDVGGLVPGAQVRLNGVVAGSVDAVTLPGDPAMREIEVTFSVDERVARRIRQDSKVFIKTLGLLGDRYLEVSSGSPKVARLAPGSVVPSEEPPNVAEVLSQSGDVVANVRAISASLRRILERVERGEGVVGELTMRPELGREILERLNTTLGDTDAILKDVRSGRGVLGKLIVDPTLEARLMDDVVAFAHAGRNVAESLDRDLQRDDSVVAGLLRDPKGSERLGRMLEELGNAGASVSAAGDELASGKGTLGRLMADENYADNFLGNLEGLTAALRRIADKIDDGKGTAGMLVNDPQLWQDVEDVLRGVRESKVLSWLIRNRREAGAEKREAAAARKE